jgi:phosphohistidine phosphatase
LTGAPVEDEPALASGASGGREVLAVARRGGEGTAVVGHNPEMAEAVAIAAGREEKVRPGTIAEVAGEALRWLEAPPRER